MWHRRQLLAPLTLVAALALCAAPAHARSEAVTCTTTADYLLCDPRSAAITGAVEFTLVYTQDAGPLFAVDVTRHSVTVRSVADEWFSFSLPLAITLGNLSPGHPIRGVVLRTRDLSFNPQWVTFTAHSVTINVGGIDFGGGAFDFGASWAPDSRLTVNLVTK